MLPKTKNPRKTRAIYCLANLANYFEKEGKLKKTAALSQSLQKMFKKEIDFEFIVKTH